MTIKECLKNNGMNCECEKKPHRYGDVVVSFYNTEESTEDSTSFDICMPFTKAGEQELSNLYKEFCKENNLPVNTVETVCVEHLAMTMDELETIC